MLNCGLLRKAKRGTIFVNISRGEISPVRDLRKLIDEGVLGGLGLDIYEDEAILAEYLRSGKKGSLKETNQDILSLREKDHVIFTPHNAFNTREALERKAKQSAEAIVHFLKEKTFPTPVPIP